MNPSIAYSLHSSSLRRAGSSTCIFRPCLVKVRSISTSSRLSPQTLDAKWQSFWKQIELGKFTHKKAADLHRPRIYVLPMFPYPSGKLHMGHVRVYTISDVIARYNYMKGRDVLHPIGWDAFGLPAENAAIDRGLNPAQWTLQNIAQMRKQLVATNGIWDWDREIVTSHPDYYKHTQKLFLSLFQKGLAYQNKAMVNWDPTDQTVLANEQVDKHGRSWRSGAKVEQRALKQWFLKITDFAQDLYSNLDNLTKSPYSWPKNVTQMQKNWLRKSEGDRLSFKIISSKCALPKEYLSVFTTRLDTLFGVQFLAVATDHPITLELSKRDCRLALFLQQCRSGIVDAHKGFLLSGMCAVSPLSKIGIPTQPLPIFVAQYVKGNYGTGAIMGVPGHDERDLAFWNANRRNETPPLDVINPCNAKETNTPPYTQKGVLNSNCHGYQGMASDIAIKKLRLHIQSELTELWGLQDWLISRQRYWGTPIPIVHCISCGSVPVPEDQLPLELPVIVNEYHNRSFGNPLKHIKDWVETQCPKCSKPAERETDTMDTFMDSSWYFFRFLDPHNSRNLFDVSKARDLMPVHFYIGGVEHAILHLLYARFISKFLVESGAWATKASATIAEPFQKLITQGMVRGRTYVDPTTGKYLKSEELVISNSAHPKIKHNGLTPSIRYEKMSKSKHNGVDPQACIAKYGADAVRAHVLFQANEREELDWNEQPIIGIVRSSLSRQGIFAWEAKRQFPSSGYPKSMYTKAEKALLAATNLAISNITRKLDKVSGLNTVVSDLLILSKALDAASKEMVSHLRPGEIVEIQMGAAVLHYCTSVVIRLMAPIMPAWAEESWQALRGCPEGQLETPSDAESVFEQPWPVVTDRAHISTVNGEKIMVMLDGRRFGEISVSPTVQVRPEEPTGGESRVDHTLEQRYINHVLNKTDLGAVLTRKHPNLDLHDTRVIRLRGQKDHWILNFVTKSATPT